MPELVLEGSGITLDLDYVAKHGRGIQVTAGVTGFGLPPIQTRWIEGAGNGARFRGRRVLPREIDLLLMILGNDHKDLQKLTNRLARVLSGPVTLRMIEDDGAEWSLDCHWVGGGDFGYGVNGNGINEAELIISLRAGSPFWKAKAASQKVVRAAQNVEPIIQRLSALPLAASQASGEVLFENEGDAPTQPLWEIDGPATSFEASLPSGESFRWEGVLTAGQKLIIDTEAGTIVDQDGVNRYDELADNPRLFEIPPGETNALAVLGGASPGTYVPGQLLRTNLAKNPRMLTTGASAAATPAAYTNLIMNPSFEVNLANWIAQTDGNVVSNLVRVTTFPNMEGQIGSAIGGAQADVASDRLVFSASSTGRVPITPGKWYMLRAWIASETNLPAGERAVFQLAWSAPGSTEVPTLYSNISVPYEEFRFYTGKVVSLVAQAPADAAYTHATPSVYLDNPNDVLMPAGTRLWADQWMLLEASTQDEAEYLRTIPYFDGSVSRHPAMDAYWTGTAHNSTSVIVPKGVPYPTSYTIQQQDEPAVNMGGGGSAYARKASLDGEVWAATISTGTASTDHYIYLDTTSSAASDSKLLEPGKTYRISMDIKRLVPKSGVREAGLSFFATGTGYLGGTVPSSVGEHRATLTVTVPADSTNHFLRVTGGDGWVKDSPIYFRNMMVEEIDPENPPVDDEFFSGSSQSNPEVVYSWTGTADASTSTKSSAVLTGASRIAASWQSRKWLAV